MSESDSNPVVPTKVVALRGTTIQHEPVPNVVAYLEDLLAKAKAGDVRAVAVASVRADRTAGTAWEKPELDSAVAIDFETHALGGAVLTLATRYGVALSGMTVIDG